jgi:hypothetical protein
MEIGGSRIPWKLDWGIPEESTSEQAQHHLRMIKNGWLHYDRTPEGINIYRRDDHRKHAHISRSGKIELMPPGPLKIL